MKKMKKKNLLMTVVAILGLATGTIAQTVPSYVPTKSLIGWWPFTGNANDSSGRGNNGTINGATLTSDRFANLNSAYNFNGQNNNIVIPNSLNLNPSRISVSIWVNPTVFGPSEQYIIDKSNDLSPNSQHRSWAIRIGGSGELDLEIRVNNIYYSFPTTSTLNINQWNNLVFIYDGDSAKLYRNNLIVISQSLPGTLTNFNYDLSIGYFPHAEIPPFGYFWNGKLDDIGIWNRALTQPEISALYKIGCSASVTTQPINQSVNISNNAQFITASSDSMATYQWQTDLGFGFQNLNSVSQYSGTKNDTLTIANTTLSNNNQPFRCIISSGSCSDTSNVAVLKVNNNVGINENSQDNLFSVYPNPAKSQINVKADVKLLGSIYTVYDNTGKVVLSGKIIAENTVIELGNLSGGIYLFSVGENLKQTFKVIKE